LGLAFVHKTGQKGSCSLLLKVKGILNRQQKKALCVKVFIFSLPNQNQFMDMKLFSLFTFMLLLAASTTVFSQTQVMSFEAARSADISFTELDGQYKSAYARGKRNRGNQGEVAFPDMRDSLLQTYEQMITDLSLHLSDKGFKWGEPKRTFLRLYFNPAGELDYFFYQFREPLSEKKTEELEKQVEKFYKKYVFPMQAEPPVSFFIFGPAIMKDMAEK
jgi:hypothetical protein